MGVETAAIYSQEVRDPSRAIPRAMYGSIIFIGLLYAVSIWLMCNHFGMSGSLKVAAKDPGSMWFSMFENLAGPTAARIGAALVVTSLFAAVLSFTNVVSRYWHALASRGLVWNVIARTHARHKSPHIASLVTLAITVLLLLVCMQSKLDPMLQVMPWASVPAAIGVLSIQTLAAISVVVFFKKINAELSLWRTVVAPSTSAVILLSFLWQMIAHIEVLSGLSALPSYILALSVLAAGILASLYTLYLRRKSPRRYAELADFVNVQ